MSTENIEVATKAKPFLRKTKFILEKNRKIKILGGFVKNGMAWWQEKKYYFYWLEWLGIIIIYGIYFFYLLAKGEEKKKV